MITTTSEIQRNHDWKTKCNFITKTEFRYYRNAMFVGNFV